MSATKVMQDFSMDHGIDRTAGVEVYLVYNLGSMSHEQAINDSQLPALNSAHPDPSFAKARVVRKRDFQWHRQNRCFVAVYYDSQSQFSGGQRKVISFSVTAPVLADYPAYQKILPFNIGVRNRHVQIYRPSVVRVETRWVSGASALEAQDAAQAYVGHIFEIGVSRLYQLTETTGHVSPDTGYGRISYKFMSNAKLNGILPGDIPGVDYAIPECPQLWEYAFYIDQLTGNPVINVVDPRTKYPVGDVNDLPGWFG